MLSNKQYVFLVLVIVLFSSVGYFFSLTPSHNQKINVQLLWQKNELGCQAPFNTSEDQKTWFIEQFQFFISDIEFGSAKSGWQKVNLLANPYQTHNTVLLGTNCRETPQQLAAVNRDNWTIAFESNANTIISESSHIRFTLGVPFTVNHLNPISQQSPLNLPSMFWVWQTGHKFMRLELASHNGQWLFHLGSTGCRSPSVMRAPEGACRYPNTFSFEVPMIKNEGKLLALNVDLAALLHEIKLNPSSSCQSERENVSCQQLFSNLSLPTNDSNTITTPRVFKTNNRVKGVDVE